MDTTSVGLGDAMLLANQNNGFGNNGGWWIWIFLIFFLMGGNGLYGGNSTQVADLAAAKTQANIWESNDAQSMENRINSIGNGISDATYALNNTLTNGFAGVHRDVLQGNFAIQQDILGQTNQLGNIINQGFNATQMQNLQGMNNIAQLMNENRFATQQGFTGVGNAIQGVNYENAMNTCKITTNSTDNTQKILDKLSNMEMNAKDAEIASLRSQLQNAQFQVSQYDQNATIVNAVRPFPQPAYLTSSPYASSSNGTCPYATTI